jgi:predicted RND superfamily exporter protein
MNESIVHFWETLAIAGLGIIVTMVGFWVTLGKNIPTKAEVCDMIETKSPYVQDRQFIMERLNSNKEIQTAFANALQRNTEVMNELKVQIATLGKTLEALEERIERA